MQIVIDITEKTYNDICKYGLYLSPNSYANLEQALKKGTPLLKHHGRLISADSLIKAIEEKAKRLSNLDTINGLCGAVALIFDEQTIVEEDTESEDKE